MSVLISLKKKTFDFWYQEILRNNCWEGKNFWNILKIVKIYKMLQYDCFYWNKETFEYLDIKIVHTTIWKKVLQMSKFHFSSRKETFGSADIMKYLETLLKKF